MSSATPLEIYKWIRKNRPNLNVSNSSDFRDAAKEALLEALDKKFDDLSGQEHKNLDKFLTYFGSFVPKVLREKNYHPSVFKKSFFSKIISLESLESSEGQDDSGIRMEIDDDPPSISSPEAENPGTSKDSYESDSSGIKDFKSKSRRQQRRDVVNITTNNDHDAILAAAAEVLRLRGSNDAVFVLKKIENDPENVGKKLRQALDKPDDDGDDAIPPQRYFAVY